MGYDRNLRRIGSTLFLSLVAAGGLTLSACNLTDSKETQAQVAHARAVQEETKHTPAPVVRKAVAPKTLDPLQQAMADAKEQGLLYEGQYTPYTGSKARIYGSTALGCIENAGSISDKNQDFQLQRWGMARNYAHPIMLQYLADLRARTKEQGLPPLLIGDLSGPLGGPFGPKSSHASHNTGIDVDLPFDFALPRKSLAELKKPQDVYIVRGSKLQPAFTKSIEVYIKTAASDPRVDRIFVAPMIKKRMCQIYEGKPGDGFLHKLRPWFGHQAHMHVRLKCPFDSKECVKQAPIPEGTGCGYEVESWFLPPAKNTAAKSPSIKPKPKPELPPKCKALLKVD